MMKKRRVSHFCWLLLAALHMGTPSSAQSNPTVKTTTTTANPAPLGYSTRPDNVTVPLGDPAVFRCGVPEDAPNLVFTLYSSHGNHSLICPGGKLEDIPEALHGSCELKDGESLAVWLISGTSFYDNDTKVVCQQSNNPNIIFAVLHVYDNGISYYILIGCTIGGFFGILLVVGLSYAALARSETLQRCFKGKEKEDDLTTIVTKDEKKMKGKDLAKDDENA